MILVTANTYSLIPFIRYITAGCIVLNIIIILFLILQNSINNNQKAHGNYKGLALPFLAFLICMHQIYYIIKPYTKANKDK